MTISNSNIWMSLFKLCLCLKWDILSFIVGLLYLRGRSEFGTKLFHHCNFKRSVITCMCDVSFSNNLEVAQNIISYHNINVGVIKQIKSQFKVKPTAFRGT